MTQPTVFTPGAKADGFQSVSTVTVDWMNRCSQLDNLIDPGRRWADGEFESMTNEQWDARLKQLRGLAMTDERLTEIRKEQRAEDERRKTALSKLTAEERDSLGLSDLD